MKEKFNIYWIFPIMMILIIMLSPFLGVLIRSNVTNVELKCQSDNIEIYEETYSYFFKTGDKVKIKEKEDIYYCSSLDNYNFDRCKYPIKFEIIELGDDYVYLYNEKIIYYSCNDNVVRRCKDVIDTRSVTLSKV